MASGFLAWSFFLSSSDGFLLVCFAVFFTGFFFSAVFFMAGFFVAAGFFCVALAVRAVVLAAVGGVADPVEDFFSLTRWNGESEDERT